MKLVREILGTIDTNAGLAAKIGEAVERIAEPHPRAKRTEHEVPLLRELIENGMTLQEIAARFAPKS